MKCNCKFRHLGYDFIFPNSMKRHICDIRKFEIRHDLPAAVLDRVILSLREGFIFMKFCEKFQNSM